MTAIKGTVSPDLTFADNGIKLITFANVYRAEATAIAIDDAGMIYVAGYGGQNPDRFWITRIHQTGATDTTFGENGFVFDGFSSNDISYATGMLITRAGGILLIGHTGYGVTGLALYNRSGSANMAFGNNGKVLLQERPDGSSADSASSSTESKPAASAINTIELPGGGFVVAANDGDGFTRPTTAMIYRLKANGQLDPVLEGTGHIAIRHPEFANSLIENLLIQPDGKWLASGRLRTGDYQETMFFRRNPDGSSDTGFGTDGIERVKIMPVVNTALMLNADGSFIGSGYQFGGPLSGLLFGHTRDGAPNTSFNKGLPLRVSLDQLPTFFYTGIRTPEGKILVAGGCVKKDDDMAITSLARFEQTGELDQTYNGEGFLTIQVGAQENHAQALVFQPDGKTLVCGTHQEGCYLMRLSES